MKDKVLHVCMYMDPVGTVLETVEQEYDNVEKVISDIVLDTLLYARVKFERDVYLHLLKDKVCDVFVFDFGGMSAGAEDTVFSASRFIVNYVKDRPNVLLILWSQMTFNYCGEVIEKYFPELKLQNVLVRKNEWVLDFRKWLKVWGS